MVCSHVVVGAKLSATYSAMSFLLVEQSASCVVILSLALARCIANLAAFYAAIAYCDCKTKHLQAANPLFFAWFTARAEVLVIC